MQSRLATLKRLVNLYEIVEEMHFVEVRRATAAVNEVQIAIQQQNQVTRSAHLNEREALAINDRVGSAMAETQQQGAGWKRRRLDQIRSDREALSDLAREAYATSRLKSEQVRQVVEGIALRAEMESARKAQSESDDRFLARRRWNDTREQMCADRRMNVR